MRMKQHKRTKWINYFAYIKSAKWRRRRKAFLEQVGYRCEKCGGDGLLRVHHKHYRTLGCENKTDVDVLCQHCHELEHEEDGVVLTDEMSVAFRATIG